MLSRSVPKRRIADEWLLLIVARRASGSSSSTISARAGCQRRRRHTRSAQATVTLACHHDQLCLSIANDVTPGTVPVPFTPRSITERAAALGGDVHIEWPAYGGTVVRVDIPL